MTYLLISSFKCYYSFYFFCVTLFWLFCVRSYTLSEVRFSFLPHYLEYHIIIAFLSFKVKQETFQPVDLSFEEML